MGNKPTNKKLTPSNRLLFQINSEHNFEAMHKQDPVLNNHLFKNLNNNNNRSPNLTPRNNKIDLQEIKATYNFINKSLILSYFSEVNIGVFNNSMITCNHQIVCDYEEDKKKKSVHFPDENKISITVLKKIQRHENKFRNDAIKIMKELPFGYKDNERKSDSSQIILEGVNLTEFKNKKSNIKTKKEKVKIKNAQVQNILTNNFMTPLHQKTSNKTPTNSKISLFPISQKHQRTNSKRKVEPEKTAILKIKIEDKLAKQKPQKPTISKPEFHCKKPSQTQRDLKPQVELSHLSKNHKREFSKRNLQLDLSSNGLTPSKNYDAPLMSSKSYHDANKTPLFQKKKPNSSSRNSSVRSKENHPPMKSILKQKKPKFVRNQDEEDSDQERKTNRESFQTLCMTDLNESRGSKSKKSQNFSSDEEEERKEESKIFFKPVKIHLKLDDLLNSGKNAVKKNLVGEPPLKHLNLNLKSKSSGKRNENSTTTDTSKEDQTKFNKIRMMNNNQKNESLSSSEISDYHKIEEIVHSNVDLQKNNRINRGKMKNKASESSSQFNHISEEASEFFREEVE